MNPHVCPLVGPLDFHNYLKRRRGSYNSMTYGYVENSSFIMSVDTFSNRLVFPCWVTFEVFIAGESGPVWVRPPVRELLLSRLFQKPAALTSPAPPLPVHSSFHKKLSFRARRGSIQRGIWLNGNLYFFQRIPILNIYMVRGKRGYYWVTTAQLASKKSKVRKKEGVKRWVIEMLSI